MNILDLFFPPKCVSCGRLMDSAPKKVRINGGDALCPDCRAEWERGKLEICDYCGRAMLDCRCVPRVLYREGCRDLIKLCEYGGDLRKTVTSVIFCLKKQAVGRCERFLAFQLSHPLKRFLLENPYKSFCITNLPRRRAGIINYGYDHAALLAKKLAEICDLPYYELLKRRSDGSEQKDLDTYGRRLNVRGAFKLSQKAAEARGMSVILVDDVVTTGASSAECCRVLKSAGFEDITVLCIARSMRKKDRE